MLHLGTNEQNTTSAHVLSVQTVKWCNGHRAQALAAAQRGVAQLETAGVLWRRPADYYAEMVKSDDHMLKVKEQLMFEQRQIEETAQR